MYRLIFATKQFSVPRLYQMSPLKLPFLWVNNCDLQQFLTVQPNTAFQLLFRCTSIAGFRPPSSDDWNNHSCLLVDLPASYFVFSHVSVAFQLRLNFKHAVLLDTPLCANTVMSLTDLNIKFSSVNVIYKSHQYTTHLVSDSPGLHLLPQLNS